MEWLQAKSDIYGAKQQKGKMCEKRIIGGMTKKKKKKLGQIFSKLEIGTLGLWASAVHDV